MDIELFEIKKIFNTIINTMENSGVTKIDIKHDFYWNIPTELMYDVYSEPKEFTIGQLSEDYHFLIDFMKKDILTIDSLRKLSFILRYIADNYK